MEQKHLDFSLEIKELQENGSFKGYGSVFDVRDGWDDIVLKGAFTKSLESKTPVMLWQHNDAEPIGVYDLVKEDNLGLYMEGHLLVDGVVRAKEAYVLLKNKAINGLSIGYIPVKWEWESHDDVRVRLLKEIDLWEVSLVTFPANPKAVISGVKSMETIRDVEDCLRDAGLGRSQAKAVIAAVRASVQREADKAAVLKAAQDLLNKIKGA